MFIPSIYKSAPQVLSGNGPGYATPTDLVITSVNPLYTRLTILGWIGGAGGTVSPSQVICKVKDATHITISGGGAYRIVVEEFLPGFFNQAFQYGIVTIPTTTITGSTAHGLTLGSNAFVVWLGNESNRAADLGGGLALTEAQVRATLRLSGANVIADCTLADYAASPGSVTVNYLLIDPR